MVQRPESLLDVSAEEAAFHRAWQKACSRYFELELDRLDCETMAEDAEYRRRNEEAERAGKGKLDD